MSDSKPGKSDTIELTDDVVIAYLRRHPQVLLNNPKLLAELAPDTRFDSGSVVDMQRFVVQRLRRQVDELRASSDELVSTTRSNMSVLEKIHDCALALLDAPDFSALSELLSEEIPLYIGVDATAVGIEVNPEGPGLPAGAARAVHALPPGAVDMLIGEGRHTRLRAQVDGGTSLYGAAEGLVQSDALIRLEPRGGMPMGLLAFGSRTEGHFDDSQGTELLGFLAEVLRYAVARWWPVAV